MPLHRKTGEPMGIAFIVYTLQESVDRALTYNGKTYGGQKLRINRADADAKPSETRQEAKQGRERHQFDDLATLQSVAGGKGRKGGGRGRRSSSDQKMEPGSLWKLPKRDDQEDAASQEYDDANEQYQWKHQDRGKGKGKGKGKRNDKGKGKGKGKGKAKDKNTGKHGPSPTMMWEEADAQSEKQLARRQKAAAGGEGNEVPPRRSKKKKSASGNLELSQEAPRKKKRKAVNAASESSLVAPSQSVPKKRKKKGPGKKSGEAVQPERRIVRKKRRKASAE